MILALLTGRALRRGIAGTIALLLGVFVFELIIPPVADEVGTDQLDPVLESLPPALLALTRTSPEFVVLSGFSGYLSIGFTSPVYLLMMSAGIVAFTTTTLAGEMNRGTIQIALSRAVSRTQVYVSRVAGTVLLAAAFGAIGPLGLLIGLGQIDVGDRFSVAHLLPVGVSAFLLLFSVGGVTLLLSAVGSSTGQVIGWSLGWLVLSYFIDYFATIWSFLGRFEQLSIFAYYDPIVGLVDGTYDALSIAVLGTTGVVGFALGHYVFIRRDLPA